MQAKIVIQQKYRVAGPRPDPTLLHSLLGFSSRLSKIVSSQLSILHRNSNSRKQRPNLTGFIYALNKVLDRRQLSD